MDVSSILESIGYAGIFASVFIESGVILGLVLPLPGFSLLFAAGVFAATGSLSLAGIIATGLAAAILGYIFGYYSGHKYGRKLFSSKNTKFFTPAQARITEKFMIRYAVSTLIVGRYLPFMHTLAPILSGFVRTPILQFMAANIIGAVLWVLSATLLGYYLGQAIPNATYFVIPVVLGLVIISNTAIFRRWLKRLAEKIED